MKQPQRVLIIGHVWPEPNSTAAGSRMLQLINLMLSESWEVNFASAAQKGEFSFSLTNLAVTEHNCSLNDSSFQLLVKEINPNIVVYDRFLTEEQFGWRVREVCPNSLQVLDSEDLHFLRKAREEAIKKGKSTKEANLFSDLAKREIGAMLRCDISLIISEVEMEILRTQFKFSEQQLFYLPFLVTVPKNDLNPSFNQRSNLVSIGNFLHEPNWDQVRFLKNEIWPNLRPLLKGAELHIYGAYASQKVNQLHQPKEGFIIKGRADNAIESLKKYRLLLAPLRFGAGLKGKIIDAFLAETPVATSSIGAEGMTSHSAWPGIIEDDPSLFTQKVCALYTNEQAWEQLQKNCKPLLNDKFSLHSFAKKLVTKLVRLCNELELHRKQHFISQVLSHHQVNAQKFMSLWIEEKNKFTRK